MHSGGHAKVQSLESELAHDTSYTASSSLDAGSALHCIESTVRNMAGWHDLAMDHSLGRDPANIDRKTAVKLPSMTSMCCMLGPVAMTFVGGNFKKAAGCPS